MPAIAVVNIHGNGRSSLVIERSGMVRVELLFPQKPLAVLTPVGTPHQAAENPMVLLHRPLFLLLPVSEMVTLSFFVSVVQMNG